MTLHDPQAKKLRTSLLGPATTSVTDRAVFDWSTATAERLRSQFDIEDVKLSIRAYRHHGEKLAASFHDSSGNESHVTFHVGSVFALDDPDCSVPDMTEALHLVGLVSSLLGLLAQVGDDYTSVLVRPA